jgi:hypothetical protein
MRTLLAALAVLVTAVFQPALAATFWTESFNNGCTANCPATGYSGPNGSWTATVLGIQGSEPNSWYVSQAETFTGSGTCSAGAGGGRPGTLHIAPHQNSLGDIGASYDAGGLCGFWTCPQTNVRIESPAIDVTGRSGLRAQFEYLANGDAGNDRAELMYFNGTVWSSLGLLPPTPVDCPGGAGRWTPFTAALPPGTNSVRVGFRWSNNDDGVGTDPSVAIASLTVLADAAVASVSVPAAATYGAGQALTFTVTFDGPVTVDTAGGTPSLQLAIGAVTRSAAFTSMGSATSATFQYVVQPGDFDGDGIAVTGIALGGGRIFDAGNAVDATM